MLAWCAPGVILISVKKMLCLYLRADRHSNKSMCSQLSGAGSIVLVHQAIDEHAAAASCAPLTCLQHSILPVMLADVQTHKALGKPCVWQILNCAAVYSTFR